LAPTRASWWLCYVRSDARHALLLRDVVYICGMQQRTRPTAVTAILAAAAIGALILSGCAGEPESAAPAATDAVLASHDLDGLSARQVIQQLDATPLAERSADLMASIRPDTLLLTDASGEETSIEM